jgi:hypothetical protein
MFAMQVSKATPPRVRVPADKAGDRKSQQLIRSDPKVVLDEPAKTEKLTP